MLKKEFKLSVPLLYKNLKIFWMKIQLNPSLKLLRHYSTLLKCYLSDSNYNATVSEAKQKISLLDHIPTEQFLVLYGLLRNQIQEVSKTFHSKNNNGATVDIVEQILIGMRAHYSEFAVTCLQVIYMPV